MDSFFSCEVLTESEDFKSLSADDQHAFLNRLSGIHDAALFVCDAEIVPSSAFFSEFLESFDLDLSIVQDYNINSYIALSRWFIRYSWGGDSAHFRECWNESLIECIDLETPCLKDDLTAYVDWFKSFGVRVLFLYDEMSKCKDFGEAVFYLSCIESLVAQATTVCGKAFLMHYDIHWSS